MVRRYEVCCSLQETLQGWILGQPHPQANGDGCLRKQTRRGPTFISLQGTCFHPNRPSLPGSLDEKGMKWKWTEEKMSGGCNVSSALAHHLLPPWSSLPLKDRELTEETLLGWIKGHPVSHSVSHTDPPTVF